MSLLDTLYNIAPFSLSKIEKEQLFSEGMSELIKHHYANCIAYKRIIDILPPSNNKKMILEEMPFLPVRLFKTLSLMSVSEEKLFKTVTSSGTSGQAVSQIFLDKETSMHQTRVLSKIMSGVLGKDRLPMLVIDTKAVIKNRALFSARGAGILGFSMLGKDVVYALDENMQLDLVAVQAFCDKYSRRKKLIFGFTHMVWEFFYKPLKLLNQNIDLSNAILIHGGGWKKLAEQAVNDAIFKNEINRYTRLEKIHNYYGMVEQTGSIFVECDAGNFHASVFSDILIRDAQFNLCQIGQPGMIQLFSLLPRSYPGHILLTEDLGTLLGEDDCSCGRLGKYFKIHGRIKAAEIRGCGDTYGGN